MQRKRNVAAWLGLGLGLLGIVGFFASIVFGFGVSVPTLRDTALLNLVLVGLGLGLSVVGIRRAVGRGASHRGPILAPLLGALNLGLAVLFILVLYPLATLPDAPAAPAVGRAAPEFTLADQTGAPLALAALHGKNVLLVFYRGHW
jgi:hypothetical protein